MIQNRIMLTCNWILGSKSKKRIRIPNQTFFKHKKTTAKNNFVFCPLEKILDSFIQKNIFYCPMILVVFSPNPGQTRIQILVRFGSKSWLNPDPNPGQIRIQILVRSGSKSWLDPDPNPDQIRIQILIRSRSKSLLDPDPNPGQIRIQILVRSSSNSWLDLDPKHW